MRAGGLVVLQETTGCEPVFWWFRPDLLLKHGFGMFVARILSRTRDDRLKKDGMLMGPFVASSEAKDSGEDSLAHISVRAPDLESTQFWP